MKFCTLVTEVIAHILTQNNFGLEHITVYFQSVEFSERAEILLFAGENVALKLNR